MRQLPGAMAWCTFTVFLALTVTAQEDAHHTAISSSDLQPFLNSYCVRCHGPDEQNGQIRFDQLTWKIRNNDEAQRWQDVLDQLNGGDMPPEGEKQPSKDELTAALDSLTGSLLKARSRLTSTGGEIAMRRLNRREYANTIESLFGFRIPEDAIPKDGEAATFDTTGEEQFFTSAHFEKYLELGKEISRLGLTWAARVRSKPKKNRRQPEARVTASLRSKLADLDNKMRMKLAGKTWQQMGFKDAGEAKIIFSQFKNRAGKPRKYLTYPLVDSGIYLAEVDNSTRRSGANHGGCDPRATYKLKVHAGLHGAPPEIRQFLRFADGQGVTGVMKVRGTANKPQTLEMEYRPAFADRNINFNVEENRADIRVLDQYLRRLKEPELAAIFIDWLETEGPFYPEQRAFFERLMYPEAPRRAARLKRVWSDANVTDAIHAFAFEAFRRQQPQQAYVARLVKHFQALRKEGANFDGALAEVFGIILSSPQFLFLNENSAAPTRPAVAAETQDDKALDSRKLAVRLAYFLWSSPPDEELYKAAADNALFEPAVLRKQVDRMLDSPKAQAFVEGFASQWAELDRFDAITVDEAEFFRFNKGVRFSARREVLEFFATLLDENLPVANLIDSKFVVVDPLLASHYGLEPFDEKGFRKAPLPPGSPRGGILGQTAFLTLGSNGERSSPVIRGAFVMEKLLHDKPAPPPPNVPELGAASRKPVTNRQMVVLHQSQAVCASCHRKMDVIGFGLENFDAIGLYRKTERVGRQQAPIDPAGNLPGVGKFEDITGLKKLLLLKSESLAKELTQSILAYALGRRVEFFDSSEVERIVARLKPGQYRLRDMLHEVAASQVFRQK